MAVIRTDVLRFDVERVGGSYRGRLARDGIQVYNGRREYRDAAEVFAPESLATLLGVRVQVTHDAGAPTVGAVEGPIRHVFEGEHQFLDAMLQIDDVTTRANIDSGELREISMGYSAELVETSGTAPNGERYDARQTKIRFDHCALLPRDMRARCGEHCRVRFDAAASCPCNGGCAAERPIVADFDPAFPGKSEAYVRAYRAAVAQSAAEQADREQARRDAERLHRGGDVERSRSDAQSRRDAAADAMRADNPGMRDEEIQLRLDYLDRVDAQESRARADAEFVARRDAHRPSHEDAESRIDSLSAAARVDANEVRRRLDNVSLRPTDDQIEDAIRGVRLAARAREMYQ